MPIFAAGDSRSFVAEDDIESVLLVKLKQGVVRNGRRRRSREWNNENGSGGRVFVLCPHLAFLRSIPFVRLRRVPYSSKTKEARSSEFRVCQLKVKTLKLTTKDAQYRRHFMAGFTIKIKLVGYVGSHIDFFLII